MNVVVRVDGSAQLGNGHVARCITLAKALAEKGFSPVFIMQPLAGTPITLVQQAGFAVHFLSKGLLSAEEDALQSLQLAPAAPCVWVLDVYALDAQWHQKVRAKGHWLLVLDDLANRPIEADALLDATPLRQSQAYTPWLRRPCQQWLGMEYALLRPTFLAQRPVAMVKGLPHHRGDAFRLLISLGGTDPLNFSQVLVQALLASPFASQLRITLVLASNAPHLAALQAYCLALPQVRLLTDVNDMAALLVQQDIALGAAGVSALERAYLGLPSVNVLTANNQTHNAKALAQVGAALNAGPAQPCALPNILRALQHLLTHPPITAPAGRLP